MAILMTTLAVLMVLGGVGLAVYLHADYLATPLALEDLPLAPGETIRYREEGVSYRLWRGEHPYRHRGGAVQLTDRRIVISFRPCTAYVPRGETSRWRKVHPVAHVIECVRSGGDDQLGTRVRRPGRYLEHVVTRDGVRLTLGEGRARLGIRVPRRAGFRRFEFDHTFEIQLEGAEQLADAWEHWPTYPTG